MKEIPLSHFFPWKKINDDFVTNILCEFADNGAESVVLTDEWGKRLVKEPGFYTTHEDFRVSRALEHRL